MKKAEFIDKARNMFEAKSGEIYVSNWNNYYEGICIERDETIKGYVICAFREKGLISRLTGRVLMCICDCMDWMESPNDRANKLYERATCLDVDFNIIDPTCQKSI